jgi:hypothetical protein
MKKLFALPLLVLAVLAVFAAASADDSNKNKLIPYKLLTTITIPGGLTGFDISWVDSEAGRYYLADRGNATAIPPVPPRIDVIDTEHDSFLDSITLPTGPNGVVAIHRTGDRPEQDQPGTLVVGLTNHMGMNDSGALFIDLAHPTSTVFVSTNGNHRADELAFDPRDHIILIANDQDTPAPFVSFITTTNPPHVLGTIVYDGNSGNPKSTGGIEQPVWDGAKKRFYIAIPSTAGNPSGEVDEIDPIARKITHIFPTTCMPAGLALIPGQRLMTSCGDVLTIANGTIVHTTGVGGDEIWFNRGDDRVYFGGGLDRISVPVVSALPHFDLITTLTVGTSSVTPAHTTHSVAADSENNHIFVPVSHEGVKVYTDENDNGK